MRDPKRIKKMLKEIEHIWSKYPDLRFLQLILNALGITGHPHLYYIEDDDLAMILKEYGDRIGGKKS